MCQESGLYDYWTKLELLRNNNNIDIYNLKENDHVTFLSIALNLEQLFDLFYIYIRSICISVSLLIFELLIIFLKQHYSNIFVIYR